MPLTPLIRPRLTFDLKVPEQTVRPKQVECFLDDISIRVGYTSAPCPVSSSVVLRALPPVPSFTPIVSQWPLIPYIHHLLPVEETAAPFGRDLHEIGAGPLILVLIGSTAIFPICLMEGSSLNAEWYAFH